MNEPGVGERRYVLLIFLLATSLAAALADQGLRTQRVFASNGDQLDLLSLVGGPMWSVAVQDDFAYVIIGRRLASLDISDPSRPLLVDQTPPFQAGLVSQVAVSGDTAYLLGASIKGESWGGLQYLHAIDISDPSMLTLAGFYQMTGEALGLAVAADKAVIANGDLGLVIADIEPGLAEVVRFEIVTQDSDGETRGVDFRDVAAVGDIAYVAASDEGLILIDIGIPASVTQISRLDFPAKVEHVAVAGGTAYVASSRDVYIVDVRNPAEPVEIGFIDGGSEYIWDLALGGDVAYLMSTEGGLRLYDVSAPSSPHELTTLYSLGGTFGMAVDGNVAYVADISRGLHILDVANPAFPAEIGKYDAQPNNPVSVDVEGDMAYVVSTGLVFEMGSTPSSLHIIDISDPAAPKMMATHALPERSMDVTVSDQMAYVAAQGLTLIDVSNPAQPREIASYNGLEETYSVTVAGSIAYLAAGEDGLRLFDVSDPAGLREIGHYETSVLDAAVVDGIVYVAADSAGLRVIDVTNPTAPIEVGSFEELDRIVKVTAVEDTVYSIDGKGGLHMFDVSDPAAPWWLDPGTVVSSFNSMAVVGDVVYMSTFGEGLSIVDVANPVAPAYIGYYEVPGLPFDLALSGDLVLVPDLYTGLYILRYPATGENLNINQQIAPFLPVTTGPASVLIEEPLLTTAPEEQSEAVAVAVEGLATPADEPPNEPTKERYDSPEELPEPPHEPPVEPAQEPTELPRATLEEPPPEAQDAIAEEAAAIGQQRGSADAPRSQEEQARADDSGLSLLLIIAVGIGIVVALAALAVELYLLFWHKRP